MAALLAAGATIALLAGALAGPAAAEEPDPGTPETSPTRVELDGAVLRWGVNHETSNRAHAPDTFNYLSAGRVPDPGRGGTSLPRSSWKQQAGAVRIQKWDGRRWRAATWKGLRTDASGAPLGAPASGSTSGLRFTIGEGEGHVDPAAGTARIAWDGDLTVVYYSGMSMFHVSDPVLEVADGRGTLSATLTGYASSLEDPGAWAPVAPVTVTLADLPEVDLGADGLSAEPAYRGVRVDGLGQVTGEQWSGSFPADFVAYMDRLGTAAFWFSSGSATDPFKVPLPLSVSYAAGGSDPAPPPTTPSTQPEITNPTIAPPSADPTPAPSTAPDRGTGSQGEPQAARAPEAALAPGALAAPPAAAVPSAPAPTGHETPSALPASTQLVSAAPSAAPAPAPAWPWWVGGALLLAAAGVLLLPHPRRSRVA
ncbi:hypothetical protein [Nocardioides marmotae]|uniref:hypothetical protein n=1 Tax=Nocardioides marmotae TaxID=2663857 RepID=UPI0012B51E7E|nr:hypothetical protein [Nocardioides marmotae]MBC9733627.1 hypothetical protein [Nocardioides marmotae]MTB84730.1 hypothetical protein [Nocardioides marmotae]